MNPAFGNTCANVSAPHESEGGYGSEGVGRAHKDEPATPRDGGKPGGRHGGHEHGGHTGGGSSNGGGATAESIAAGSPGVLSGNGLQLPVDLPANISGNSVNAVGIGNPTFGNTSVNVSGEPTLPTEPPGETPVEPPHKQPPAPHVPAPAAETEPAAPVPAPQGDSGTAVLASTGSGSLGYAVPGSAALLLGGALLYRRARRAGTGA
nr:MULTISPECIES: chaplin [unclassified Streptomyces]